MYIVMFGLCSDGSLSELDEIAAVAAAVAGQQAVADAAAAAGTSGAGSPRAGGAGSRGGAAGSPAPGLSRAILLDMVSFLKQQLQLAQLEILDLHTQVGTLNSQQEGLQERHIMCNAALSAVAVSEGEAYLEVGHLRGQLAAESAARLRLAQQCEELQNRLLSCIPDRQPEPGGGPSGGGGGAPTNPTVQGPSLARTSQRLHHRSQHGGDGAGSPKARPSPGPELHL